MEVISDFGMEDIMFKVPSKFSITVSIAVSIAFFVLCIAVGFYMPEFAELMVKAANDLGVADVSVKGQDVVLGLAYMALLIVVAIDVLLFILLLRVEAGKVFTAESVALIRGVSWGCFLIALVFCGLAYYFTFVAVLIIFVALFLGLCLRVVKNVIEEATEIKNENDLTV